MRYTDYKTLLYSDTPVPDIFISEYMPALKGEYVKIYLYCLFLAGKDRGPSVQDLAKILDIPQDAVKKALQFMDNLNILTWADDCVMLKDLKEIEIKRFYRPKSSATPEEAAERGRLHTRRRQAIEAINDTFYGGLMSPAWFGDIHQWFDAYGFDEDVMVMLFRHCRDSGALTKPYIVKVAEHMSAKGVKNSYDFDRYLLEYERMRTVGKMVEKRLKMKGRFNEFHEEFVDKWTNKYGFSFDVIDVALRGTVDNPGAAFNYFDKILTDWHSRGIDTAEKARAERERRRASYASAGSGGGRAFADGGGKSGRARRQSGFTQRQYDDGSLDQFVTSDFGGEGSTGPAAEGAAVNADDAAEAAVGDGAAGAAKDVDNAAEAAVGEGAAGAANSGENAAEAADGGYDSGDGDE